MSRSEQKNIFFLFPGPKYDLEHTFRARYSLLSKYYRGVIFTSRGDTDECSNVGDFKLTTTKYLYGHKYWNYFLYMRGAIRLAIRCKKEKANIDIVVVYDPLVTGIVGYIVSRYLKAKLIVEVNGDISHPAIYMGEGKKWIASLKRKFLQCVAENVIRRSDGVKLLYKSQIDWIKNENYPRRLLVGPDFVDIMPFLKSTGKYEEKNIILLIGFPFYIKGVDVMIEAFKKIELNYPSWILKILGWYPDKTLIQLAIGESKQIIIVEPVPHSEMAKEIASAKIIAQPSRTEAMGRALVEAAAAGKARIASNTGGIPTVLEHNVTGFLFDSGCHDDLAEKLKLLMNDCHLREKFGCAARKFVEEYNSPNRYVENTHSFYESILME